MINNAKPRPCRGRCQRASALISRKLLLGLGQLLLVVAFAVAPAPALANYHEYCDVALEPTVGCPPNGETKWWHLYLNQGWDSSGSHEVCIDEFLDGNNNEHYTTQTCWYALTEEPTRQYPGGEWGYPRAWNGGSIKHLVRGIEEGE
jgi:hypothetical protein